jgi:hypothetical protein
MTLKSFNKEAGTLEFGHRGAVLSCSLDEALDYSRWSWDDAIEIRNHLVMLGLDPPAIPETLRPEHPEFDPLTGVDKSRDFAKEVGDKPVKEDSVVY